MYVRAETKAAPKLPPILLISAWLSCICVLFYSSAGQRWATTCGSGTLKDPFPTCTCQWSRSFDIFFSATYKIWWCIGIAFICYASLAEQGGPFGYVLGMGFWTPFAKLTFGVYMMHLMAIRLHGETTEGNHSEHYTDFNGAYTFTANYTIALLMALFMCVAGPNAMTFQRSVSLTLVMSRCRV
jgi:peptidoglycan/LPS O-acetylase OafA/YrhL